MMSGPTFTMECTCGRVHTFEPTADRVECDCGTVYAVTLTELRPPGGDPASSSDG